MGCPDDLVSAREGIGEGEVKRPIPGGLSIDALNLLNGHHSEWCAHAEEVWICYFTDTILTVQCRQCGLLQTLPQTWRAPLDTDIMIKQPTII